MENKYITAGLLAIAAFAVVSVAGAHSTDSEGSGMGGMMRGMGMMGMMNGNFVHDQDDIDWMKDEMKEHMNFTDEEFDEMAEHCPMMRGR